MFIPSFWSTKLMTVFYISATTENIEDVMIISAVPTSETSSLWHVKKTQHCVILCYCNGMYRMLWEQAEQGNLDRKTTI